MLTLLGSKRTCFSCKYYTTCTDENKSFIYTCDRFKETKFSEEVNVKRLEDLLNKTNSDQQLLNTLAPSNLDHYYNDFDITTTIQEALAGDMLSPPDLKVRDSQFDLAPNFYTFVTSEHFLYQKPYLEQALLGLQLFSEICPNPKCTDLKWLEKHSVKDKLSKLEERIQLLHHGVCPKCHTKRSDFIRNKKLNYYNTAAICAGQRCVTGDTIIFTEHGMMCIGEYAKNRKKGFTEYNILVSDGKELKETSDFFVAKNSEKVWEVTLTNGYKIKGTRDHPILTPYGFNTLQEVNEGDEVLLSLGSVIFGNVALPSVLVEDVPKFCQNLGSFSVHTQCDEIPIAIRQTTKEGVFAFLKGILVNGIYDTLTNDLIVSSKNHTLLHQVGCWLLGIGIFNKVEKTKDVTKLTIPEDKIRTLYGYLNQQVPLPEPFTLTIKVAKKAIQKPYLTYDLTIPDGHRFWTNGMISHNSGKSAWTAMVTSYITHWQLMQQNPIEMYGLLKNSVLYGTFVALTFDQARATLWEPFYGYMQEGPWFISYHDFLKDTSNRIGEEIYRLKDTYAYYRHRHLYISPSGPNKKTLRGYTRFFGSCLTGDSLVSTNKGLIRIDSNLIGLKTHVGNKKNICINNNVKTGNKHCYRITLKNGLEITATKEHPFAVLNNAKTDLDIVLLESLKVGDYAAVSLGGDFPKELLLDYKPRYTVVNNKQYKCLMYIRKNADRFLIQEVAAASGLTYCGVTAMMTKLKRHGLVNMLNVGRDKPRIYSLTSVEYFDEFVYNKYNGKINRLKQQTTFPTKMTEDLAYLLGYLVADGNYIQNFYEISFSSKNLDKIEHFCLCFEELFNISPRISKYLDGRKYNRTYTYHALFGLKLIRDFLIYVGLTPATAKDKIVPWSILQAPLSCVIAFLSAAVSCDGSIKDQQLYYTSKSKNLIQQMQLLFIRLGYACNYKRNTKGFHTLTLLARDRNNFLVNYWCGLNKRQYHTDYTELDIEENGLAQHRYKIPGVKENHLYRTWDVASVYVKDIVNKNVNSRKYKKLLDKDIVFSEIVKIKHVGKQPVYNLAVDSKDRLFTANGFITHNCDELGWMDNNADSTKVKMNANEIYIALERSLRTVRSAARKLTKQGFDNVPTGYNINISSPSSARDKIMELVKASVDSRKIFAAHRPTWEMNPTITRKDLDEEFRTDPVAAMRDYGAQPPLSANPFINSTSLIEQSLSNKRNKIELAYKIKTFKDGTKTRYAKPVSLAPNANYSVLSLDAGFSGNSFSVVNAHLVDGKFPVLSLMVEIMPLPGIPLNFSKLYTEIIEPIIEQRNVQLITADRWNSLKFLSDAENDHNIFQLLYSVKYTDFVAFKELMNSSEILLPKPETSIEEIINYEHSKYPECFKNRPVDHFILQCLTVQDTGSTVIKGENLTDDIFRAAVLATTILTHPDYKELFLGEGSIKSEGVMGMYRGLSSGVNRPTNASALGRVKSRGG